MVKTIVELASMKVNDKDVVMMDTIEVLVTKDEYDTTFNLNLKDIKDPTFSRSVSIPNSLVNMVAQDATNFSMVSNRTCTILYYMAGYNPEMSLRDVTTIDMIIGGAYIWLNIQCMGRHSPYAH